MKTKIFAYLIMFSVWAYIALLQGLIPPQFHVAIDNLFSLVKVYYYFVAPPLIFLMYLMIGVVWFALEKALENGGEMKLKETPTDKMPEYHWHQKISGVLTMVGVIMFIPNTLFVIFHTLSYIASWVGMWLFTHPVKEKFEEIRKLKIKTKLKEN